MDQECAKHEIGGSGDPVQDKKSPKKDESIVEEKATQNADEVALLPNQDITEVSEETNNISSGVEEAPLVAINQEIREVLEELDNILSGTEETPLVITNEEVTTGISEEIENISSGTEVATTQEITPGVSEEMEATPFGKESTNIEHEQTVSDDRVDIEVGMEAVENQTIRLRRANEIVCSIVGEMIEMAIAADEEMKVSSTQNVECIQEESGTLLLENEINNSLDSPIEVGVAVEEESTTQTPANDLEEKEEALADSENVLEQQEDFASCKLVERQRDNDANKGDNGQEPSSEQAVATVEEGEEATEIDYFELYSLNEMVADILQQFIEAAVASDDDSDRTLTEDDEHTFIMDDDRTLTIEEVTNEQDSPTEAAVNEGSTNQNPDEILAPMSEENAPPLRNLGETSQPRDFSRQSCNTDLDDDDTKLVTIMAPASFYYDSTDSSTDHSDSDGADNNYLRARNISYTYRPYKSQYFPRHVAPSAINKNGSMFSGFSRTVVNSILDRDFIFIILLIVFVCLLSMLFR